MLKILKLLVLPFALFATEPSCDIDCYNEGKKLYTQTCVSCHGVDGTANTDMQLVVKPRNLTKSILNKDQLYSIIKDGSHAWGSKSDIMGSFGFVYNKEDIENIALYVYEKFSKEQHQNFNNLLNNTNKNDKVSLKRGKKIFNRNCSMCHGITGNGESDYVEQSKGAENFIYPYDLQKIILNENQIFLYSKHGGKYWGTDKNDMPSWKTKYDDATLKSVAKYINEQIKNR